MRDVTARVRAAAARHGRPTPRFSLSVRPILADTEEKAWAKAEDILARATALQDKTGYRKPADGHATAGARRLLALAEQGTRIDKRLWTEIAKLTGANSNTTALVGTPEQVAEVFGDYYDLGISHFLIRGFDPLIDAIEYGRELIPLTRKLIAERAGDAREWPQNDPARTCRRAIARRCRSRPAQTTLRVGDQKGNSQAVMEAAGVLKDVPYKIEWKEFPAAAPLLEALGAGAIETGSGRRRAVHLRRRRQRAGEGDRRDPADARGARDPRAGAIADQELRRSARQEDRHRPRLDRPSIDPRRAGEERLEAGRRADRVPRAVGCQGRLHARLGRCVVDLGALCQPGGGAVQIAPRHHRRRA